MDTFFLLLPGWKGKITLPKAGLQKAVWDACLQANSFKYDRSQTKLVMKKR